VSGASPHRATPKNEDNMTTMDLTVGTRLTTMGKKPNELTLFSYSAATWNQHRIHFDKEYSASEGHRGLVVQGPLQGEWLVELVGTWFGARGRVRAATYRNLSSGYANDQFTVEGVIASVEESSGDGVYDVTCEAWVNGPEGRTTEGTVVVEVPMIYGAPRPAPAES
jgi:acyl dehydratase